MNDLFVQEISSQVALLSRKYYLWLFAAQQGYLTIIIDELFCFTIN